MTRKTYIKKMMSIGYSRNEANQQAESVKTICAILPRHSYKSDWESFKNIYWLNLHVLQYYEDRFGEPYENIQKLNEFEITDEDSICRWYSHPANLPFVCVRGRFQGDA